MTNETKITVEIPLDKLQKAVNDSVENILKSGYSNPIRDAVERAIKEKGNDIEALVKQTISEAMSNPEFKTKLGEVVMAKMFEAAFKK